MIDENGNARFAEASGTFPFAVLAPTSPIANNGGSFSGSGNIYGVNGNLLDNGGSVEAVTVSGNIVSRTSISGTSTDGAGNSGTFAAQYDAADYQTASSTSTIAGTYSFSYANGNQGYAATITISATGSISGSDTAGCTYSGSFTVPNTSYNAYDATINSSCISGTINGIAVFTASVNGSPATILALGNNNSAGFYELLTKTN